MRNARREQSKKSKKTELRFLKNLSVMKAGNPNSHKRVVERKALSLMKAQEYASGLKLAGTPKKTVLLGIKQYGLNLTEARAVYKKS